MSRSVRHLPTAVEVQVEGRYWVGPFYQSFRIDLMDLAPALPQVAMTFGPDERGGVLDRIAYRMGALRHWLSDVIMLVGVDRTALGLALPNWPGTLI